METKPVIEDFYGVYLLCSQSAEKKFRNKIYIGYTVNPNRRIIQHNAGKEFGGAKKTSDKGPWKMILIIHGFPNNISALQFEWAWQKPKLSSRLKSVPSIDRKKPKETNFDYNFRVLSEMLSIGPWDRLPLKIRWLAPDYVREFPADKLPPMHMEICHGHVAIKKKPKSIDQLDDPLLSLRARILECHLCMKIIDNPQRSKLTCINRKCKFTCHAICLAKQLLPSGQYLPVVGDCLICEAHFLWGDLIRKKNGCNDLEDEDQGSGDEDWQLTDDNDCGDEDNVECYASSNTANGLTNSDCGDAKINEDLFTLDDDSVGGVAANDCSDNDVELIESDGI